MKLGLGTVQFGTAYGISNTHGQTTPAEVAAILAEASQGGVRVLDTAPAYGNSEQVLGRCFAADATFRKAFRIVTKSGALGDVGTPDKALRALRSSVQASLTQLGCSQLHGLLLHSARDYAGENAEHLFSAMALLKQEGLIGKAGASVYAVDEADTLLNKFDFDLIQVPLNLFDQSFLRSGVLKRLKKKGVEVHSRSVFLQGLLLMNRNEVPASLAGLIPFVDRLQALARARNCTPHQLAVDFVRQIREVDSVIVGVNDAEQIRSLIAAFRTPHLSHSVNEVAELAVTDARLTNPSRWAAVAPANKKKGGS